MTKIKITSGTASYFASQADTTYTMAANQTIDATNYGIEMIGSSKGRVLQVDGKIDAGLGAILIGLEDAAVAPVRVTFGEHAELTGPKGIVAFGNYHIIRNEGSITAVDTGIEVHGTQKIINSGEIHANIGINVYATDDGTTIIRNSGIIDVGNATKAIYGSGAKEMVANTGTIHGDVDLADGDDVFYFKSGEVDGEVRGGHGNDVYIVQKAGLNVVEDDNAGNDQVISFVTFTLNSYIENLKLMGTKNIDAIGNGGGNEMYGNDGKNLLFGWYGNDALVGGKGNDTLTGGAGEDQFHFIRGGGKDIVTDFETGFDEVHLGLLKGAKNFDDMLAHHITEKGDDLWITYGGDTVVLKHTDSGNLDAGDFFFA